MRISDWSSDVCSSDLQFANRHGGKPDGARTKHREAVPGADWPISLAHGGRQRLAAHTGANRAAARLSSALISDATVQAHTACRAADRLPWRQYAQHRAPIHFPAAQDRTSVVLGQSVSVRVDLGGRGSIKK